VSDACPFCEPDAERVFFRSAAVIGLWDRFPVSPGHALLTPVRHCATWFDATRDEQSALIDAIDVAKRAIEAIHSPDGYNIGINAGAAAGQTVPHLHVHLIPRYQGDVYDARGGVRHVIPAKANYLVSDASRPPGTSISLRERALFTGEADPLLPELKAQLAVAESVDIAVAFTLRSGLELLEAHLQDLLDRGGRARVVTGDYLDATDPDALLRLLDLSGRIECRVFETADKSAFGFAFHPKAYMFMRSDGTQVAFIGSSNLSRSALTTGVEWNYRLIGAGDAQGVAELRSAFELLLAHPRTVPLTAAWVKEYRTRRRSAPVILPTMPPAPDAPVQVPPPHEIQTQALEALRSARAAGTRRGLVVLATGLGKTWLSAYDSREFSRVLFVAHREEILNQAIETYRKIRPQSVLGRYTGAEKSSDSDVLFASIQTLSRPRHLEQFARNGFDYIVVDEFHHAEARTYRRLLDHFEPRFLLGLTATPERTDGADLLALCDNQLVFRCDLVEGIRAGLLCSFRYFGVPDEVDYSNIPWRNRAFDEDALTKAVATQARAANALDQYRRRAGSRTLAFCVSQRHADFMAGFFRQHGVRAAAVHAGPASASRVQALEQLSGGELDVVCAVDMFNEGVDVPTLDTVMMLRPTESRIVWLQQFGRGLRKNGDKRLTVIDYIGNHRSFLIKPQALFGLPEQEYEIYRLLESLRDGTAELPPGCEVTYELEAQNILRALLGRVSNDVEAIRRRFHDFRALHGVRPTAAELYREGYNLRMLQQRYGSWLGFVSAEDALTEDERRAFSAHRGFLESLENTRMVKSYKMLVLLALVRRSGVPGSLSIDELAGDVRAMATQDARVGADLADHLATDARLRSLLQQEPIEAWIEGRSTGGVSYFAYERNRFSVLPASSGQSLPALPDMTEELAEWRLAEYFKSPPALYVLNVSHSDGGRPILFLPARSRAPDLPRGWHDVEVGGEVLSLNFVEIAVNVAQRAGASENVLPEILQMWFGPNAGATGAGHKVVLRAVDERWRLEPQAAAAAPPLELWKAYRRDAIPAAFGLTYSRFWEQGFVRQGSRMFLLVTLDKSGHVEAFKYKDHFVSDSQFQWQSQNRTKRDSDAGRLLQDHLARDIEVHLLVRPRAKLANSKGAPFYYCGLLDFIEWTGDQPITVQWRLRTPVPRALWAELSVPPAQ
jgi:superfamily II DNA or RNA helicase/HKD family nuclease/diadenosine tetraphosphate (Ap4A) HIT family hydrolase